MKAGEHIKAFGHNWTILDTEYDGSKDSLLLLSDDIWCEMPMYEDGCDSEQNYAESDIKKYLEKETKELEKQGAKPLATHLDMLADDGTGWDKEPIETSGLFLLTKPMYQKYRKYIEDKDSPWWLSTKWSYRSSCYSGVYTFCRVYTDGSADTYHTVTSYGVAPAFLIQSDSINRDARTESSEQPVSIGDIVEDVKIKICNEYCKFPGEYEDKYELYAKCEECPLCRL